jgi:hypothetical protein
MPVIDTEESWCVYMDTVNNSLNGEVGHRCPGLGSTYSVTSAFYFIASTKIRFTIKRCEGCGESLPKDITDFIHMLT